VTQCRRFRRAGRLKYSTCGSSGVLLAGGGDLKGVRRLVRALRQGCTSVSVRLRVRLRGRRGRLPFQRFGFCWRSAACLRHCSSHWHSHLRAGEPAIQRDGSSVSRPDTQLAAVTERPLMCHVSWVMTMGPGFGLFATSFMREQLRATEPQSTGWVRPRTTVFLWNRASTVKRTIS